MHDLTPDARAFAAAIVAGLGRPDKSIPAKYFYDAAGSRLFDAICDLDEYYLTRTEQTLLAAKAGQIAALMGPRCHLIEFGSGASHKVRLLLDACREPLSYVAVDISRAALVAAANRIAAAYPALAVYAVCADYTMPFALPELPAGRPVGFFPGSTIGNFTPEEAVPFLTASARMLGPSGAMLIGVDLKKDPKVLHAAYNDAKGVTAAFNLNLLARANRELGADFDLAQFVHRAFYDPLLGRIEMHLVSQRAQTVRIEGKAFAFAAGETIHTENSYKYTVAEFQAIAANAGFRPAAAWTDADNLFGIHYLLTA